MSATVRDLTRRRRSPMAAAHGVAVRYASPTNTGQFGQWCTGVVSAQQQMRDYARFWTENNERALDGSGPLWVALGDSTAQGVGASTPLRGYVGLVQTELTRATARPWRVVNLSRSGATALDVLVDQLSQIEDLPDWPSLVTCGVGGNDVLATPPRRLHTTLRALIRALPDCAVMLDLPLPVGLYFGAGRAVTPYVAGLNRTIYQTAAARGIPVARYSRHYTRPWDGRFAADRLHPSDAGYADAARALLAAIPPAVIA